MDRPAVGARPGRAGGAARGARALLGERVRTRLSRGGLGVRARDLALARVDAVNGQHVENDHQQQPTEDADHDVCAALLLARGRTRAMLGGKKVDGVHAALPSASPAATVWRYGSSCKGSLPVWRRPSGSATVTGT